ncbi:MAG: NAD/NADP octopine/nopaline dehydrogenase family protein [Bacillota bacterium]
MKVAVLGSGNGGCAVAFDFAEAGHDVFMFDFEDFPTNIEAISQKGGINSTGDLKGFQEIKYAGHDIKKVVESADIIFAVGPAYSTKPFGEVCAPYLESGQIVIVCPSSCGGSIVFKNATSLEISDENIIVAETSTLPYAVRITEPGSINVFLKLRGGLYLSTLPSNNTKKVLEIIKDVYNAIEPADNILQTTLQNGNPIIHPAVSLLNTGQIERDADLYFYEEGVTPAVGRLIKAVDQERIKIGKKLGFKVIPDPELGMMQGYMQEPSYEHGYANADGFKGIKAQEQLDYRYFNEDVRYGLIFFSELGKQIGVDTPVMDSIIEIVSVLMEKDYRSEKMRTMDTLGLGKYSNEELKKIL